MIQSWKSQQARLIFEGRDPGKGFPRDLVRATRRKLAMLNVAKSPADLMFPMSNRLHQLKGDRAGQWSIYVNDQWRICFEWGANGPENVEFVDYD